MAHNYTNTASRAALDAPLNSSANSFTVTGLTGYPSVPFYILVDRDTSSAELMEVTAVAGSTLTVNRGAGGTAGTSHSSGGTVEHVIPAAVPQAVEQHVEATTNVHGVTGALIGADSTGTLANKTFRGAHTHVYSDTLPDSPAAGFLVSADNSVARDGFVANNTGANTDRAAIASRQAGSDRFVVYYDGTVKVTPSGSASRPAFETTGNVKAENFESTDDITAAGDITAIGNIEGAAGNFGNLNVSGTMSSTGNNALGVVTAAGKITGNGSGTGMTITNTAEVGALNITSGNAVFAGTDGRLQFPANPTALPSGAAAGQARFRANLIEVHDGTSWYRPGSVSGSTDFTPSNSGTFGGSGAHTIDSFSFTGGASGSPYYILVMGQCEINNVPDGTRFDLTARLDSNTGTVVAVGLGNGFTQTGTAITTPLTGDHTIYFVIQRTLGGGTCEVTPFNCLFTAIRLGSTTT